MLSILNELLLESTEDLRPEQMEISSLGDIGKDLLLIGENKGESVSSLVALVELDRLLVEDLRLDEVMLNLLKLKTMFVVFFLVLVRGIYNELVTEIHPIPTFGAFLI